MPEIIPAILAADRETLIERLRLVEGIAHCVQIDCMDGHFVPNRSFYTAEPLDTTVEIELHLMVSDPSIVIEDWKRVTQMRRAIWHIEIPADHGRLIDRCGELGWECGLALSPETSADRIAPYADAIDEVLVLGVKPGFSGQTLIASTVEKAAEIKRRWPELSCGFDGGATRENLHEIARHGLDRINIASAIYSTQDPSQTLRDILSTI